MSLKYLAHVCTGTGNCFHDPQHSTIIKARGYDDALEKFANTREDGNEEIHVFIYDMSAKQCVSGGFFGKVSHWKSFAPNTACSGLAASSAAVGEGSVAASH